MNIQVVVILLLRKKHLHLHRIPVKRTLQNIPDDCDNKSKSQAHLLLAEVLVLINILKEVWASSIRHITVLTNHTERKYYIVFYTHHITYKLQIYSKYCDLDICGEYNMRVGVDRKACNEKLGRWSCILVVENILKLSQMMFKTVCHIYPKRHFKNYMWYVYVSICMYSCYLCYHSTSKPPSSLAQCLNKLLGIAQSNNRLSSFPICICNVCPIFIPFNFKHKDQSPWASSIWFEKTNTTEDKEL